MASNEMKSKYADILVRPRITEKASLLKEKNIYVFEIKDSASKKDVALVIKSFYGIKPVSIKIVRNPSKDIIVRGKRGKTKSVKKAYVHLKKGDKIE